MLKKDNGDTFLSPETVARLASELSQEKSGGMPTLSEIKGKIDRSGVFPFGVSEDEMRAQIIAAENATSNLKKS